MKITLLMALTLDGKIARNSNQLIDWTESADKKLFIDITKEAGCIVMGSKTYDTIGKALPHRKNIVLTRNKSRKSKDENLVFTDMKPEELLASLASEGFDKVVLVGGAIVNSIFAGKNLIDEIIVTISPRIFGSGLSLFSGEHDLNLDLKEVSRLGKNSVFLRYVVLKQSLKPEEATEAQVREKTPPLEERATGVPETGTSARKKVSPLTIKEALEKNFKINDMGIDDANALFELLTERKDPTQRDNAAYRLVLKINEKVIGFLTNRFQEGERIYDIMTPVIDKATGRNTGKVIPSNGFAALKSIIENALQDSEDVMGKKLITVKGTRGTRKIDLGGGKFRFRYIIVVAILHLSEKSGNRLKRTTLKKVKGVWKVADDFIRISPGNQSSLLEALGVMKNGAYMQSFSNIMLVVNGL